MKKLSEGQEQFLFFSLTALAHGGSLHYLFDSVGFLASLFGYLLFLGLVGMGFVLSDKMGSLKVMEQVPSFIAHTTLCLFASLAVVVAARPEEYKAPFFSETIAQLAKEREIKPFDGNQKSYESSVFFENFTLTGDEKRAVQILKTISSHREVPDLGEIDLIKNMPLDAVESFIKEQERAKTNEVFTSIVRQIRNDVRI